MMKGRPVHAFVLAAFLALAALPAGAQTLPWPSKTTLGEGDKYLARMKGRRVSSKLVLHLVPEGLPTDAHRAAWMADKGCLRQARRLLARLR